MKNFFKVLSLAVVAAFVLASCQKEEALGVEPRQELMEPFLDKVVELENNVIQKKVVYDASYSEIIIKNQAGAPPEWIEEGRSGGHYWTVTLTSPTTGEKQQWLWWDVASSKISLRTSQSDDPNGEDHGYYYKWDGGANLTQAEINSIIFNKSGDTISGFKIPTTDDTWKLKRIVGSDAEAVHILNLQYDGKYVPGFSNSTFQTDEIAFWLDMPNGGFPDAGSYYWIYKDGGKVKSAICYPNNEDIRINLRLVRDLN